MKLIFLIQLIILSNFVLGQTSSRNDKILVESSELIYDDFQEAQRLLSFVNHSNSDKNHQILASLVLSDASYLKGDFVAAMNHLYRAEDLLDSEDLDLRSLVDVYFAKYYRILGFKDLGDKYFGKLNSENLSGNYNLKAQFFLEKSFSIHSNEKINLLNSAFNQIDTATIFGNALKNEIQFELAEIQIKNKSKDVADKNLQAIIDSEINVFQARVFLLKNQDLSKADSLLKLNPDVISQISLFTRLAENSKSNPDLYKKYVIAGNELEAVVNQSKTKARDLVISHIENQKIPHTSIFEKPLFWILVVLILLSLYGVIYYLKTQRDYKRFLAIMQKNEEKQKETLVKTHSIPEKTEQLLLKKLDKFEQSHKYISSDISLTTLAKSLDTNTKYLSDIINRNKGCNFNQYINEMRINYIIEKMKSEPKYLNYKMFYLAEECGFSSQSSFSTVFKSVTGISPLSFIKFMKNEIKAD